MAKKRNYKTRKHTHQLWITARAGIAIVDFGREGVDVHLHQVGTRRKNAIRLACSVGGCRAYRFAYFNLAGEFIRFGDIRYEGKAGQ